VAKFFIDTNILVYTLDPRNAQKHLKARNFLQNVIKEHNPVISTQVLKEFYVVATVKLKADPVAVKAILHNFQNLEIVNNDFELIEQAIDISISAKLSFWDSLIIAAAEKAQCEAVFSEDLNPGQLYRGIRLINPFS
jgi:predicted nucleic acid-binding protein